jgi:hypothetical protein
MQFLRFCRGEGVVGVEQEEMGYVPASRVWSFSSLSFRARGLSGLKDFLARSMVVKRGARARAHAAGMV